MLALAADENFNNDIVRDVRKRCAGVDILRVQDVGLAGADDETILDWAAHDGRVLLSHDMKTIPKYAYERVASGKRMPGVFMIALNEPTRRATNAIRLMVECSVDGEWENQVVFLPFPKAIC